MGAEAVKKTTNVSTAGSVREAGPKLQLVVSLQENGKKRNRRIVRWAIATDRCLTIEEVTAIRALNLIARGERCKELRRAEQERNAHLASRRHGRGKLAMYKIEDASPVSGLRSTTSTTPIETSDATKNATAKKVGRTTEEQYDKYDQTVEARLPISAYPRMPILPGRTKYLEPRHLHQKRTTNCARQLIAAGIAVAQMDNADDAATH